MTINTLTSPSFLAGELGKGALREYGSRARKDYGSSIALSGLKYEKGMVTGSGSFALVLMNSILDEFKLGTATPADLERILRLEVLQLRSFCLDSGLALMSDHGSREENNYFARDLAAQLKRMGKPRRNILLPLTELELRKDANSPYGISFVIKEDANIIHAPILGLKDERFDPEDVDEETGLPTQFTENGSRHLFRTGEGGLARFGLNRGSSMSLWHPLHSAEAGKDNPFRIVVVPKED